MKTLKLFALALMAVGIVSCGGKKSSKESNDTLFEVSESSFETVENEEEEIYDEGDFYEEDAEENEGTQDWDALLNSYEQYVDKYISYMNKAAKGDMSALSEYPALMEKAQELSDRMVEAQGEMSSSQWNRYVKITTKMTEAAQKIVNTNDEEDAEEKKETQDWNALLNSYEQYVDKYISYMNKAAKGDMSALSEYPALMEKAQELSNQMGGAQGEMSSSQWSRYLKITTKMTEAAQKIAANVETTAAAVTSAIVDELEDYDDEDDEEDDDDDF